MKYKFQTWALVIAVVLFQTVAHAQIRLPKLFGNDMVLQRDIAIPVWGNATPRTMVTAELGTAKATATADKEGKWVVRLPKFKAGGPYTLKVYETEKPEKGIELKGILIGDVWLASGQSNMEWAVHQANDAQNEIAQADYPEIRLINVEHNVKFTPQSDILSGEWKVCDSLNVAQFSAVAYYFARKIHQDNKVPVGIIQSAWGGTPVEAWTSRDMLLTSPITQSNVLANDTITEAHFEMDKQNQARFWEIVLDPQNNAEKTITQPAYDDTDWARVEMPNLIKGFGIAPYEGILWMRKKIRIPESFVGKTLTLELGHPEMNYSLYFNGAEICKSVWNANPTHRYQIPVQWVNSGENTLAIRMAMLWSGGGISADKDSIYLTDGNTRISLAGQWLFNKDMEPVLPKINNFQYRPEGLFNAMINPVIPFGIKGFIWYQGESNSWDAYNYRTLFPMLITDWRQRWGLGNLPFLYVQLANYMKNQPLPSESEWAELRESQALTMSLPNTGMACIIDIGDAGNIHPGNKQEVGRRLALIANKQVYKQDGIAYGPTYKKFRKDGNRIRVRFSNVGSALATSSGKEVVGFAVAGNDRKFYWAKAMIEGDEVIVYSDQVAQPVAVRYAWADNPECNLINSEGLPAVPFRTDHWNGITQR